MPYYLETNDREKLKQIQRNNLCLECEGELEPLYDIEKHLPYLQCKVNPEHEGIARINKPKPEFGDYNIPTRRKIMAEQTGDKSTAALERIPPGGQLTQPQAMHILQLVYPDVPKSEIIRCAILCRDFGLHPLMKEVYIIPFGTGDKRTWSTVLGINATRKMMSLRGSYSYMDNTPRIMTEEEQTLIFGEIDKQNIVAITKLRTRGGEVAPGYGRWPRDKVPYGMDHGNTKANMAFIRSERNAFGRLFPDSIPPGVEIVDEAYTNMPELPVIDKETGEIIEGEVTNVTPPEEAKQQVEELAPEVEANLPVTPELLKELTKQAEICGFDTKSLRGLVEKMKAEKGWKFEKSTDMTRGETRLLIAEVKKVVEPGKEEKQEDSPF